MKPEFELQELFVNYDSEIDKLKRQVLFLQIQVAGLLAICTYFGFK